MAKTLLDCVNEVLKRSKIIQGDSGLLTSLTDAARQLSIDLAVQVWNEQIDEIYAITSTPLPNEVAEATITLVADQRDYVLAADLVQLRWPMADRTNGQFITPYPGGYEKLIAEQAVIGSYTGLPISGVISPIDGKIYFSTVPQASEAGLIYTYLYDKDMVMTLAADTVPFKDAVFRSMVPAVTEKWRESKRNRFNPKVYRNAMSRASTLLTQNQKKTDYMPRKVSHNSDPFEA